MTTSFMSSFNVELAQDTIFAQGILRWIGACIFIKHEKNFIED